MREFKFRAFDKYNKRICNIVDINFSDDLAKGVCYGEWSEFSTNELMQYTGLKDKNGVEIYEGDIIRAKDYLTNDNITYFDDIGVIEFKDGMFYICDDYPTSFKGQIIEVIGNIYQNPELLEGDR